GTVAPAVGEFTADRWRNSLVSPAWVYGQRAEMDDANDSRFINPSAEGSASRGAAGSAGVKMIRMQNVEKSYPYKGGQTWVLRQVNVAIAQGEFVTIMGPSGSGKSTLLAILGMLDGEFGGEYFFDDVPVHGVQQKQ